MLRDRIEPYFIQQSLSCSEAMFRSANDEFQLQYDAHSLDLAAGFSGGMFNQNLCGAFAGAVMALGAIFTDNHSAHESPILKEAVTYFLNKAQTECGSCLCKDLTPVYKDPETRCLRLLLKVADILQETVEIYKNKK